MIMGMTTLTFVHVLLSLIGVFSGLLVVFGMLAAKRLDGWTALFLLTTILTSVTGFLFPCVKFLPSHAFGIISLIALPLAILARFGRKLAGAWRPIYVVCAVLSLYLNVFVLIVQLFEKVSALTAMAPTLSEPPFKFSRLACLVSFVLLGIVASMRFQAKAALAN